MAAFPGFPAEGLKFFRSLRKNNTREWFQPRKEIFDSKLKAPMEELVALINGELAQVAPDHIVEPKKAVYRIYRDTRFSSDKTPYKTHIAANFPRRGLEKHAGAGFYFSVSDEEIEVAGGVYMPGPPELMAIRTHIAANHADFHKLATNRKLVAALGPLKGEALRRPPKGFDAEDPAADYLRMKQWYFFQTLPGSIAATPAVFKEVADRFKLLAPYVHHINTPLLAKARKVNYNP